MSALMKRLIKLESESAGLPSINIFVIPFCLEKHHPIGLTCNGAEVHREPNETTDELLSRLKALVVDNDLTGVQIFMVRAIETDSLPNAAASNVKRSDI